MEQELSLPTCLFGGPPVRDDTIKLGESQIGFMNIFARPLFESVADILPNMRFSVDEIIENKIIWQKRIEEAKARLIPQVDGGIEGVGASVLDQARSPLSTSRVDVSDIGPMAPTRTESTSSSLKTPKPSFPPPPLNLSESSRRASPALKSAPEPRRSSVAALPIPRHLIEGQGNRNPHSRRGSADASLTTILVTQNPSKPSEKVKKKGLRLRSQSPGKRRNSRQGLGFFRHKPQPSSRSDSPVRPPSSSAPPVPPLPSSNDSDTQHWTPTSSSQTDFVIQPRVPGSPYLPTANGALTNKNLQPPHSGAHSPVSPISVDSDYEVPPHMGRRPSVPPKPTTSDGPQPEGEAPPLPRWKAAGSAFRSRHSRKGSLTPSLTGFEVQPPETSSSADKSAHTTSEAPTLHTLEGVGEGTSGRPKSRGGVFGRFWRRKIRGDKASYGDLQQEKDMPSQTQGFQYPPPPKTPVNSNAAGPRRGSMPLLPGSFPDTPPHRRQERER